jgi:hypothetical protein
MITTNPVKKFSTLNESVNSSLFSKKPSNSTLSAISYIRSPALASNLSAIRFVLSNLRLDYIRGLLFVPRPKFLSNQIAYMPLLSFICLRLLKSLHRMTSRALERTPNELASRRNPGKAVQIHGACWLPRTSSDLHLIRMHGKIQLIGSRQGAAINP